MFARVSQLNILDYLLHSKAFSFPLITATLRRHSADRNRSSNKYLIFELLDILFVFHDIDGPFDMLHVASILVICYRLRRVFGIADSLYEHSYLNTIQLALSEYYGNVIDAMHGKDCELMIQFYAILLGVLGSQWINWNNRIRQLDPNDHDWAVEQFSLMASLMGKMNLFRTLFSKRNDEACDWEQWHYYVKFGISCFISCFFDRRMSNLFHRKLKSLYHETVVFRCMNRDCNQKATKDQPFKVCGKCKAVRYCSKHCQKVDWKNCHQHHCSALFTESIQRPEVHASGSGGPLALEIKTNLS